MGALTSRWIKKVVYFADADMFFVAELTNQVMGFIYCPREEIEWQDSLFCISRGVACRKVCSPDPLPQVLTIYTSHSR